MCVSEKKGGAVEQPSRHFFFWGTPLYKRQDDHSETRFPKISPALPIPPFTPFPQIPRPEPSGSRVLNTSPIPSILPTPSNLSITHLQRQRLFDPNTVPDNDLLTPFKLPPPIPLPIPPSRKVPDHIHFRMTELTNRYFKLLPHTTKYTDWERRGDETRRKRPNKEEAEIKSLEKYPTSQKFTRYRFDTKDEILEELAGLANRFQQTGDAHAIEKTLDAIEKHITFREENIAFELANTAPPEAQDAITTQSFPEPVFADVTSG